MPGNGARLRNFVFTINNPTDGCLDELKQHACYMVAGQEVGESGTPHIQGYAELPGPVAQSTVVKWLPRAHLEKRKGNAKQAAQYCMKDGNYEEIGTRSQQGDRVDIKACTDKIKAGKRMRDVADEEPVAYVKYHRGLEKLQKILIVPRTEIPDVRVYWGSTGTGKTARAMEWLPDAYMWTPALGKWWDGYEGEKDVILDEFRGQIPFGQLLNLLDRYQAKVEFKGGVCQFAGTRICLTSPLPPAKWYKDLDQEDKLEQLLRRIHISEQTG